MKLKRRAGSALVGITALLVVGAGIPAAMAGAGDRGTPTPGDFQSKGEHAAQVQAAEGPEEEGEEENEAAILKARASYAQSIQSAPGSRIPIRGVLAARKKAQKLPVVGGSWTSPTNKPFLNDPINRGFNYGVGHGVVTGRMTALTASGRMVYAGSASGGVWRSADKGKHWSTINKGLPRLSVGAIATDPKDGSIWLGTGEANNASENQYGTGVYRLERGAKRWERIGGHALWGSGAYSFLWAKKKIYVATNYGLYRRSAKADAKKEWHPVLQPNGPKKYPPSSAVTDVIKVPGTHGRQILAVVGWSGYSDPPETEDNGFYMGNGEAGSFTRLALTGDINPATIGRTSFTSSGGRLYAVVASSDPVDSGTLIGQGVYRSTSGPAGPWTRIADTDKLADSDSALGDEASGFFPGIQADYNQDITADPKDPNHVYLQLEEVFESTDGGATWKTVGPYWNFDISCEEERGEPYDCPRTTHPDQHAGMIYKGEFWAGNDGGVWRRPVSWHDRGHWVDLNATLYTTQNYSVDVGQMANGYAYWGGLQDNGESYTRDDMDNVEQAFTGDGGDTIVNPSFGDQAVVEYVFLDMYMTQDGFVTTAEEISPSCLTAANPPDPCDPNPRFIAPIERDVNNPNHWVAGGQFVWEDRASWDTICSGPDPTTNPAGDCDWDPVYDTGDGHQVTGLGMAGDVIYAGWCGGCNPPTFNRGLATNYGGTWHELSLAGVPNRYITSIAVDPNNAAHAYLSLGSYSRRWIPNAGYGHVFETTDGGVSWHDVSGNLPDAPVYHIAMGAHGQLVAGSEVGAFIAKTGGSHASGLTWSRLGHHLPDVTVWDIVTRPQDGMVVAGTHGRGDWVINLE
jgi:hypothetical protein